jgi:hypothetical protein
MNAPALHRALWSSVALAAVVVGGCGFSAPGTSPAATASAVKPAPTREELLAGQLQTAFLYSYRDSRMGDRIPPPNFTWTFNDGTFEIRGSDDALPEDLTQLLTGDHLGGPRTFKDAKSVTGEWRVECRRGADELILSEVDIDGWRFTGTGARLSIHTYNPGWMYAYGNSPVEVTFSIEPLPGQGPPRPPGAGPQDVELLRW